MAASIDTPQELTDREAVQRFFSAATEHPASARFSGVTFETVCRRRVALVALAIALGLLTIFLLPLDEISVITLIGIFLVYSVVEKWTRYRRGINVRVWLPLALCTDLQLESRSSPREAKERLDARFRWSATSRAAVRQYIGDALLEALEGIAVEHHLEMTDRYIQFGPMGGRPARSVELVVGLIEALPRPPAQLGQSGPPCAEWPDTDEDAAVVAVTSSREEADLWSSMLAAANIAHLSHGSGEGRPFGAATPQGKIQMLVPSGQAARARDLLDRAREIGEGSEQSSFCHSCGATVTADAQTCADCGANLTEAS